MNQRNQFLVKLTSIAAFSLSLAACSAPEESSMGSDSSGVASNFDLTLTIPELMSYVLDPASDSIWGAGGWVLDASGYEELYPTTDDGWNFVKAQAAVVAETGNLLALPGRAADNDAWIIYSKGLSEAGLLAMKAAEEQNKDDFFQAGAQIYSVCTACHQAYNPDILSKFAE